MSFPDRMGLCAVPRVWALTRFHATSTVALVVGAASIAAAISLILELNDPYGGLTRLSDAPLRKALALIGRPVFLV